MSESGERPQNLREALGIEFTSSEPGLVTARMEVTPSVCQHCGVLNGGASLAMAETLAGHGSLKLCQEDEISMGIQVSGNHVRAAFLGTVVTGEARLVSKTRTIHVWNVDITDEQGRLVSTSRVTNCVIKKRPS